MANTLYDNTYFIFDSSATALEWPSGARINNIVIWVTGTNAAANFNIVGVGTPIFRFNFLTVSVGSSASIIPNPFIFQLGNVQYKTAWIPSTLTACSAWINFA